MNYHHPPRKETDMDASYVISIIHDVLLALVVTVVYLTVCAKVVEVIDGTSFKD